MMIMIMIRKKLNKWVHRMSVNFSLLRNGKIALLLNENIENTVDSALLQEVGPTILSHQIYRLVDQPVTIALLL